MNPETRFVWHRLRDAMKDRWVARRIEDIAGIGTPDIAYAIAQCGWIELKYVANWPKRKETKVRLTKYTAEQRLFLRKFGRLTQHAFLLVRVEDTYLLFDWLAAQNCGDLTQLEMRQVSLYCETTLDPDRLVNILR